MEDIKNRLLSVAWEVRKNSYSPYSCFSVGAALIADTGEVFVGVNVENASYGLTVCAERSAVLSAIAAGKRSFSALALAADAPEPVMPCGACLQVLAEFGANLLIISENTQGKLTEVHLADLLPRPFA